MPRNGAGTFSVLTPIQVGQLRSSSVVNANFEDAGTALTDSLPIDGQAGMTGQFKADEGSLALPSISFAVDPNTGFRLTGTDAMAWVSGAQDRATLSANGVLTLSGGLSVAGSANISSGMSPQTLANISTRPLAIGRTENDTNEHELVSYQSGNGSGATGSLRLVGTGSNAVSVMRFYVNNVKAFEWGESLFGIALDTQVGASGQRIDADGHIDFPEVSAAPSAPASNVARIYARDNGSGRTDLYWKDSSGTEQIARAGVNQQVFTSSGTWTKPEIGTLAFVEAWGAGGGGGGALGNLAFPGAGTGGGGGCYASRLLVLASLSSSISVSVGAGGVAGVADSVSPTDGSAGGTSSFGSHLAAYGGGGGHSGAIAARGGSGGGGPLSAGMTIAETTATNSNGAIGGSPLGSLGALIWGGQAASQIGNANPFGGASGGAGGSTGSAGGVAAHGGGGGGGSGDSGAGGDGGASIYGAGGGGAGRTSAGTVSSGGSSLLSNSGAGGSGGNPTTAATSATAPGGGGGGGGATNSASTNATSGERGQVKVTVW